MEHLVGNAQPFDGSIPHSYEKYLVPLIFEPYARDIVAWLPAKPAMQILETAAGTGIVTRRLAERVRKDATIIATDVSQPMLDLASTIGTGGRPVEWRRADAMQLPFGDETFDVVVCQFGVMFFADKVKAFSEARRVLKTGGCLLFNVWDAIEENEFVNTVVTAVGTLFPGDPPHYMRDVPHGYHNQFRITRDLANAGFRNGPTFEVVEKQIVGDSPMSVALAYCQGTPLKNEIESRDAGKLVEAIDAAELALGKRFGFGPIVGKIRALTATVRK